MMKNSINWKSRWADPLRNEDGSGQIITYCACICILILIFLFGFETARFIITASEQNDLADSIMRDSMRINNGLTPTTEAYLEDKFRDKGFDISRLTITGTPAGVPFGTEIEGQITYEYHFPFLRLVDSLVPDIALSRQTIRSEIHVYALGVVR